MHVALVDMALLQLLPLVAATPPVHDWTTNPAATLPYLNGSAFPRYIEVIKPVASRDGLPRSCASTSAWREGQQRPQPLTTWW